MATCASIKSEFIMITIDLCHCKLGFGKASLASAVLCLSVNQHCIAC